MKSIQRSFLISLIPLLTPLTAIAEADKQAELVTPIPGTKGTAASWRASQVIGTNVKNTSDETIGEVNDLVLNMKSGEILAVVITSGGFLGIGDTLSSVPVSALRYDVSAQAFKTKLTKEQLGKAPQFKTNEWPDYEDATHTEALRSYRDSIRDDVDVDVDESAADNSAQNEKRENKEVMIPTDQGNSDRDVQITKNIRSSVMDTDLSFNAKNIKIITRNENVVLKGVVETHAEHESILKIAKQHAGSAKVSDQLKVKSK